MNSAKIVRAVLGVAVVGVILLVVNGWYTEFKSAPQPAATTTSTVAPQQTSTAALKITGTGTARIEGVNFRVRPQSNAKLIRGLKKGEKVTVMSKDGQWYRVKDSKGVVGWITADSDYVFFQAR